MVSGQVELILKCSWNRGNYAEGRAQSRRSCGGRERQSEHVRSRGAGGAQ